MSIILVKKDLDKIIIGADSQESSGESSQENILDCKLKKISNDVYIAGAGNAHVCSMFYAYVEKYIDSFVEISNKYDLIEYFDEFSKWSKDILEPLPDGTPVFVTSQFIIIIKDRIWCFNNYYIREIEKGEYSAIGSGVQPALACINITNDFNEILKAVCKVDIYCSEPITIMEIPYGQ